MRLANSSAYRSQRDRFHQKMKSMKLQYFMALLGLYIFDGFLTNIIIKIPTVLTKQPPVPGKYYQQKKTKSIINKNPKF